MGVLGLIWGVQLAFQTRIGNTVARANPRRGVMKRLPGCTWGLETNILRSSSKALIRSPRQCCLTLVGSGAYGEAMSQLDERIGNVPAKRTARVSRTAQLAAVYALAGTFTILNMYHKQ